MVSITLKGQNEFRQRYTNLYRMEKSTTLTQELKALTKRFNAKGGIIVIQTERGVKISQIGLSHKEIREDLCLTIYYAERMIQEETAENN